MSIIKQPSNSKGSLMNIQKLVNSYPSIINNEIKIQSNTDEEIIWLSPLLSAEFAEYRDDDFLKVIGHDELVDDLSYFWPKNGPQWDGLAKSFTGNIVFLVEAKANLPELKSPPSGAKSKTSIDQTYDSLERTKSFISEEHIEADWSKKYYQYTNRLAHLYFLREKGINAYLIFLYFIGDKEVNGPETKEEWVIAKQEMERTLQLPPKHKLSDYILDIYIHVNEITEN